MAEDTLPQWVHQRFRKTHFAWDQLSEYDRDYWRHEAAAVRRAVARDGFKDPTRKEEDE
jgi:uncharacterized protein YvpB